MTAPSFYALNSTATSANSTSYSFSATAVLVPNTTLIAVGRATASVSTATISDTLGLTWTLINTYQVGGSASGAWWAISTSTASVTISMHFTADAGTGFTGAVYATTSASTSPIAQESSNTTGSTAVTPNAQFASALDSSHGLLWFLWNADNPAAVTEPSGFTEAFDGGHTLPGTGFETAHRAGGVSSTAITAGSFSASNWGAYALAINPVAAAAGFFGHGLLIAGQRNMLVYR